MEQQSMPRPAVMKSLLWKDGKSIWALVLAIWTGILVFNLFAFLINALTQPVQDIQFYICVWILLPNLVALGAPALLVGSEEETGTLNWLRTLPVPARKVVDSKFVVSLASVLSTWLLSTLVMALIYMGWDTPRASMPAFASDMFSVSGIATSLWFTMMLLLSGFITAYLIRSPIAALLTLIPLVTLLSQAVNFLCTRIITGSWAWRRRRD